MDCTDFFEAFPAVPPMAGLGISPERNLVLLDSLANPAASKGLALAIAVQSIFSA